ncbi:MAG: FAD:protein FMN transferase, partial [Pseudobdellovibrionaceae bacterium]
MGTFFEVQYIEDCQIESGNLALEIRAILDVLESEFSLYQAHSPLSRLNQSGELDNSSEVFRQVLRLSLDQEKKTMGKFNIAVLPVLSLVRQSFLRTGKPPPVEALKKLRSLV